MSTPEFVSVDDHVFEPPELFEGRLPERFKETGPRVIRKKLRFVEGSRGKKWVEDEDARWCDAWHIEDVMVPVTWLMAPVGRETVEVEVATYDEIHAGTWKQHERLLDMEANHVSASMCFPNLFRFAGQIFSERKDKDLGLASIVAYNDWIIDEWAGGEARGKILPVTILPLWDAELAAAEVRRCAAKGSFLVTFPENPHPLGFPSLYEAGNYWSPFFTACEETETIVNMHIGTSSRMFSANPPDAPWITTSSQTFINSQGSLLDYIFSGTLERHPALKISYAEGQVGWYPYLIERADKLWGQRTDNEFGSSLKVPPSEFIPDRVFFCIFDDEVGLRNRDLVGMKQITFETDYPHPDSTFPHTQKIFEEMCTKAGLSEDETYGLARGNAIRGFGLSRYGISA
jgi:predicted TIM-barrel fold metal-dependent hydrolase